MSHDDAGPVSAPSSSSLLARHVWIASPDSALGLALSDRMAPSGWRISRADSWFQAFSQTPPTASVQMVDASWTLQAWPDCRPATLPTVHWCDAEELLLLLDCQPWPANDAYVLKPYDACQLQPWITALQAGSQGNLQQLLRCGQMVLDIAEGRAVYRGRATQVQGRQLDLMRMLIEAQGELVPRSRIEEQLYRWGEELGSNAIDVHIHALRRKLGAGWIETLRGRGYRLCPAGDAPSTL